MSIDCKFWNARFSAITKFFTKLISFVIFAVNENKNKVITARQHDFIATYLIFTNINCNVCDNIIFHQAEKHRPKG